MYEREIERNIYKCFDKKKVAVFFYQTLKNSVFFIKREKSIRFLTLNLRDHYSSSQLTGGKPLFNAL